MRGRVGAAFEKGERRGWKTTKTNKLFFTKAFLFALDSLAQQTLTLKINTVSANTIVQNAFGPGRLVAASAVWFS